MLHKNANHLRRVHQRKRKKFGNDACVDEAETAKAAKTTLCKAIQEAKKKAWSDLCDQIQKDPWSTPYKLVMGKLGKPSKIPGLDTPDRMTKIIRGLFPALEQRPTIEWPLFNVPDPNVTTAELRISASQMKNSVAPGPDRVPNEAIKIICHTKPEILINIYNKCIAQGHFPRAWKKARLVLLWKGNKRATRRSLVLSSDMPPRLRGEIAGENIR